MRDDVTPADPLPPVPTIESFRDADLAEIRRNSPKYLPLEPIETPWGKCDTFGEMAVLADVDRLRREATELRELHAAMIEVAAQIG